MLKDTASTNLCPLLIFCPTEEAMLAWVAGFITRWYIPKHSLISVLTDSTYSTVALWVYTLVWLFWLIGAISLYLSIYSTGSNCRPKFSHASTEVLLYMWGLWAHLFWPVLYPSLTQGLATPWTYFLHLSLSCAILIDSSTGSPVHVLMSIQAVRGILRLHAPGIVPCII